MVYITKHVGSSSLNECLRVRKDSYLYAGTVFLFSSRKTLYIVEECCNLQVEQCQSIPVKMSWESRVCLLQV